MKLKFLKDFTRFKKPFKKGDVVVVGVDLAAHAVPIVLDEGFAEVVEAAQPPTFAPPAEAPTTTKATPLKATAKDKSDAG